MRDEKWKLELRSPGTRRVFEAMRMVGEEMSDFDDDDIPELPAWMLTKRRQEGGGHYPG